MVDTATFDLPSYTFICISLNEVFGTKFGTTVLLELFNPGINQDHAGFDGNLRFWGIYGNNSAIVHSMALAKGIFKNHPLPSSRRHFPSLNDERENHGSSISPDKYYATLARILNFGKIQYTTRF